VSILRWIAAALGGGASVLAYGAWTSDRIQVEERVLRLPNWPASLDGFRIGLLTDLHVRGDRESERMSQEACAWLADQRPDITVLGGDFVSAWMPGVLESLARAISPLQPLSGSLLAIPGNHEYTLGGPENMAPLMREMGIRLLRNEWVVRKGVCWVGIDSGLSGHALPFHVIDQARVELPTIALWHEPDYVDVLPRGLDLMLAGHSHGGQFCAPWGWPPMTSRGGTRYVEGFYAEPDVPLYVSRGLGTTGPPSRLNCPAEVAVLTLIPGYGEPPLMAG
jgi:uncharacterized protein